MATINTWNNQVLAANVTFNGGTMQIGTDSIDNAINIGSAANAGRAITIGNATGTTTIEIDCGTTGIARTTSATYTATMGSTTSTSSVTVQSGSMGLSLSPTSGTFTMNAGTGTINISADATANTIAIGTDSALETMTLGSTNSSSSLTIQSGTGNINFDIGSSGAFAVFNNAGPVNYPRQPAFLYYLGTSVTSATGDGAKWQLGTTTALTKVTDQQSNTTTGGTFTAPVTGHYFLSGSIYITACTAATSITVTITTSAYTYAAYFSRAASSNDISHCNSVVAKMTAADTATVSVTVAGESSNSNSVKGASNGYTSFSGYLVS
jgi:hypothetical protein